jgi:cell wall-associated NlpC family hydrolase
VISTIDRQAPVLLAGLLLALALVGSATGAPATVRSKQAEAQRVLAQVQEIDAQLAHAAEAFNGANEQLKQIEREQRRNAQHLELAQGNLGAAQASLERHLVALYTSGGGASSTLEIILGATSLDDFLTRIETMDRVSAQDAAVLDQVKAFRAEVQQRRQELAAAERRQAGIVAERAARKAEVERRLAERQRLLASVRSEVARLEAQERARSLAAARAARARIAAQGPASLSQELVGIAAATPEATVAPPARYGGVVGIAMQYLGVPYRWGGESPSGFDCSGFVMYVYRQVGVSLPHNAAMQYSYGTSVSRSDLQPGDIVFFSGLGHNGIYIGGGQFVHAPRTGDVVKVSSLDEGWYAQTWYGAKRL